MKNSKSFQLTDGQLETAFKLDTYLANNAPEPFALRAFARAMDEHIERLINSYVNDGLLRE